MLSVYNLHINNIFVERKMSVSYKKKTYANYSLDDKNKQTRQSFKI